MYRRFVYIVLVLVVLFLAVVVSAAPQGPGQESLYIVAGINTNHIYARNIQPNADVTIKIYEPGNPEALFDETMPSSGKTEYFLPDFQHQIDLQEGYRIVVADENVPDTKELTLVAFDVTDFVVGTSVVEGTAPPGSAIEGHVSDDWIELTPFTATADQDGNWIGSLSDGGSDFVISEQTNLEVWTEEGDDDGDRTQYEIFYTPINIQARYGTDVVTAHETSPDDYIEIMIYDDENETTLLFGPQEWPTQSGGYIEFPLWQWGFDLTPGMLLKVEDLYTGITKDLLVEEFTGTYHIDSNRLYGIAPPNEEVFFEIGRNDGPMIYTSTIALEDGTWELLLDLLGPIDFTGWGGWVFDEDGDATKPDEGEEPPHAIIRSYIHHDQLAPMQFVPDSTATIEVFLPGNLIQPIYTEQVQLNQWGQLDTYHDLNIDLIPDMVLGIEDTLYDGKQRVITMTLSNLSITDFDPETNTAQGLVDPGTKGIRVFDFVDSGERQFFTVDANDIDGSWSVSFDSSAKISRVMASIGDNDGNSTGFYLESDDFLQMVDSSGDTLTATDEQGDETTVEIPPGAIDEQISLAYIPRESTENLDGFSFVGAGFELNAYQDGVLLDDYTFQVPISITLEYSDEDLVNINENSLTLDYWDETTGQWLDAATTCDLVSTYQRFPNENYVVVEICHLSRFALMGENQFLRFAPFISR